MSFKNLLSERSVGFSCSVLALYLTRCLVICYPLIRLFDIVKTTVNPRVFPDKLICFDLSTRVSLIAPRGVIDVSLSESVFTMDNYTKALDHAKAFDYGKASLVPLPLDNCCEKT